jgi:hypothetical protein
LVLVLEQVLATVLVLAQLVLVLAMVLVLVLEPALAMVLAPVLECPDSISPGNPPWLDHMECSPRRLSCLPDNEVWRRHAPDANM